MPTLPSNAKCATLGCKEARSKGNGFCLEHGGRDKYDQRHNKGEKRQAHNEAYQTGQWVRLRKAQLSKHPLCAACEGEGIVTPAAHVDHLFPWSQIGKEAFYRNIFQSLCQPHHSEKTALEQRGTCRLYGTPSIDYGIGDYHAKCG